MPGAMRAIGAVWRGERRLHWASPLQRHFEGIFDPLPFMLRFPDAQPELSHFEAAIEWLDAVCFGASDPAEIQRACASEPSWRLHCLRYEGPRRGADLTSVLGPPASLFGRFAEPVRAAVLEAIEHLARAHPRLRGMPLESVHGASMEVARLHVTEGRRVRVIVHPQATRSECTDLALVADDHLRNQHRQGDRALLVLPRYRPRKLLQLTPRAAVVGLQFDMVARALLQLAAP
ncbi:MAG TPA: hypothetical protein VFU71_08160 [Burkholderiaceae bacterium]|nr:hypothetical protein [Burkholderiaceae bacterium]